MARIPEDPDHPRRDEDEDRRQRAQAEQHKPEDRRGDAPRTLLVLLEQLREDRDEGRRERRVRDECTEEVRELEGHGERVDAATGAEVVRRDDLAHEPEDAREPGRGREDRCRDGEAAARRRGRRDRLLHDAELPLLQRVVADRQRGVLRIAGNRPEARPHLVEVRRPALFAAAAVAFEPAEIALAVGVAHRRSIRSAPVRARCAGPCPSAALRPAVRRSSAVLPPAEGRRRPGGAPRPRAGRHPCAGRRLSAFRP